MAVRYSGDVEVRIEYLPEYRAYRGHVRAPHYKKWFMIPSREVRPGVSPVASDAYDRAAELLIQMAEVDHGKPLPVETKRGNIHVRRLFQSACPGKLSR